MVEYFGKHSCEQAIRNKPTRFGYKVWCQNTSLGYLITFDLYQGKTYKGNEEMETRFGKCASTVLLLLDQYSNYKKHLSYHIFMDNLFTSTPLLFELMNSNKNGTGTMRDNRIDKKAPFLSKVSVNQKAERLCTNHQCLGRISIKDKKWWWSIFTWIEDVSIQNAWFLSRQVGGNISQLNFKKEKLPCLM